MSWAEAKKTQLDAVEKLAHIPDGMRSFTALPNNAQSINLTFLEPDHVWLNNGTVLWTETEGVMIRYSDTDYPASPTDGTLAIDNKELGKYQTTPFAVNGLTEGTTYYFSAFPYSTEGIYGEVSHATAIPFDGERVQVQMTLPEGLESATVKCVDETASTSEEQEVTQSQNTATFFVDTGHTYHVEYSNEYGYVTPPQTESKIASGGGTVMVEATYTVFASTINVTYTEGATCTCSNGDVTLTATDTSGFMAFTVGRVGTWTIQITKEGEEPKSDTVEITANGQTEEIEVAFLDIVPWSTGTDEQIAAMLEAHYAGKINIWDYWAIGDERQVHLSAISGGGIAEQDTTWVLMHKGGCELTAGGYCAAVVGMKDCMKELRFMNSGGATSEYGWGGCYVRVWCNNSFKESLPASMLPLFKQFKVTAAYGGGVPSPNTNDDYFALPAEKEVLGTNMNASETGEASLFQFDWYKTLANRVKQIGGSAIVYWLRSPSSHDGRKFCTVGTNGGYNNDYAHVQHGISPFGCI